MSTMSERKASVIVGEHRHEDREVITWIVNDILKNVPLISSDSTKIGDIIMKDSNMQVWLDCFKHESISDGNYEKKEFVGDKFINAYHTIALGNNREDDLTEEDMSNMVGFLQSNIEQAKISDYHNLTEMLSYVGGEITYSIKSDVLEAIVGALMFTTEIARPGLGFPVISNYLDYLYGSYEGEGFDYSTIEKKVLKTEMMNMVRIRDERSISLSTVSFQIEGGILYIHYLHYLQKTFFSNFWITYRNTYGKPFIIDGVEYRTDTFEILSKNITQELKIQLKELGNDFTTVEKAEKFDVEDIEIIIPNYVVGFFIDPDRRDSEKGSFINMRDNFASIGINPELVKNTRRELRLKRVLDRNDMFHDYKSFKYDHRFLPNDMIFFKEYRKLRTTTINANREKKNIYTVSLFEIREGVKTLLNTIAGEDVNMIEKELLQNIFNY